MEKDLKVCLLCTLLGIVFVIIISIKEKENVITNFVDFFYEWWQTLKNIVPVLLIIAVLLVGCLG